MTDLVIDVETSLIPKNNDLRNLRLVQCGFLERRGEDIQTRSVIIDHNRRSGFEYLPAIRSQAAEFTGTVIMHKAMFDLGVLDRYDIRFPKARIRCTQLGVKNYNENETTTKLKAWATYLGFPMYWLDTKEQYEAGIGSEDQDIEQLETYNDYDLRSTLGLYDWLAPRIKQEAIWDLESQMSFLIARMQRHGLKVDEGVVTQKIDEAEAEIARIEAWFTQAFGEINLDSPYQVASLLYDRLKLPILTDDWGNPLRSTAEEVLKRYNHTVVDRLLEYRGLKKLVSSYYRKLLECRTSDGLVFGDFIIRGTETGRLACRQPPLQTWPEKARDCFSPQYDYFVWLDLSQIEYRITADLANEVDLIEGIKAGYDVHRAAAKMMFGQTDDHHRHLAKTCNFAILYGAGIKRVMDTTGLPYQKAVELIRTFEQTLPRIVRWKQSIERLVERGEVIVSPYGRRRHMFTNWRRLGQLKALQREAVNFIPQSMGHDTLYIAWQTLHDGLQAEGLKTTAYANEAHDEIVLDVPAEELDKARQVCKDVLASMNSLIERRFGYRFKVPISGEVKHARKWS